MIILSDGTDNKFGRHNTNVVKLYQVLESSENQKCFYDPGVGTYTPAGIIQNLLGKAFGFGLTRNIEDSYPYLMNTYRPGDRIYLFGFSRGAFTVRCLAGMLQKCGLLEKDSDNLVSYA